MSSRADLAAILEADTLTYIRVMGIFLVVSIALFSFLEHGKTFSLIALIISLILGITITAYYFIERHRISTMGYYTKVPIDVLMYVMIGVILLNIWLLIEVWNAEPVSLVQIAEEIEQDIKRSDLHDVLNKMQQQNESLIKLLAKDKNIDISESIIVTPPPISPSISPAFSNVQRFRDTDSIRQTMNNVLLASTAV